MKRSTLSSSSIYFSLYCIVHVVISANADCDKSQCPGPIAYYRSLRCTPVYANEDSCCAYKYDCRHLYGRSTDICHYQGHEYAIGELLREEDANPCDIGCTCSMGYNGVATFSCAIVDCFAKAVNPGCYRQNSVDQCCPGNEICPENPSDRPKCEVEGKEYKDGEYFTLKSDPEMNCICLEGYTGENVEPWCKKPAASYCSPEFRHAGEIYYNCSPIYYSTQNPATDCSVFSRCQNEADIILKAEPPFPDAANSDLKCKFGNMTMSLGDELKMGTNYNCVCVKCVCEVPPVPTCKCLPDEKCDASEHPPFEHFQ